MNYDELKNEILESNVEELYQKYCLGQNVWYFSDCLSSEEPSQKYDDFKAFVSNKLDVHFNDIAIIGSSKTGFSLSPKKNLKFFDEGEKPSDIDLVIVSNELFDRFWDAYLKALYDQKIISFSDLAKSVFKGYIGINDKHVDYHPHLRKWINKVNGFQRDIDVTFEFRHEVNYRVFKSWDYVRAYYTYGFRQLKQNLERDDLKKTDIANKW